MDQKQLLEAISLWFTTKGRNNMQLIPISFIRCSPNLPNVSNAGEEIKNKGVQYVSTHEFLIVLAP